MRRRNTDLHARVNGDLTLDFGEVKLTSYAGLELFQRYLRRMRFNTLIRTAFRGAHLGGDFGVVAMVRLLIGLLVVGGRRLDHVAYVADDPLFRRFCRLQVLPTARTVSRWLTRFTMTTVARLQALNAAVIAHVIPGLRLHTVTVDVDGVVVSTGLQVERAFRGFNPHRRKVPSYYPIMAHLAETTHVLRVKNRSGNVHDGKASLPFLRELWTQLTTSLAGGAPLRFRMDGAFFRQDVLTWLAARGAGYGIKVPFYHWLDLQQYIRATPTWTRVAPDVSGFVVPAAATPWGRPVWVAIYRKKVAHRTAKNFQLDLFDPNDGSYQVLRHHQQSRIHGGQPLVFHGGPRESRKDHRAAQRWPGVSHRAHDGVCRQWCLAAAGDPHAQLAHELPTRDRRGPTATVAEAHDLVGARDDSDAPVRGVPSSGRAPQPRRTPDPAAWPQQCNRAAL